MNLLDLLVETLKRFLRWAFSIHFRWSTARQMGEYGHYRSALMALSKYLFIVHMWNALRFRELLWEAQQRMREVKLHQDELIYGTSFVNDGVRVSPADVTGMEHARQVEELRNRAREWRQQ